MRTRKKKAVPARGKVKAVGKKLAAITAGARNPDLAKKEQITLRLDADVVDFFRAKGIGYQTQINNYMGIAMADARMRNAAETPGAPWYEESRTHEAMANKLFRPKKEQITLRLDADVVSYFREKGKGYQSRMNRFLRLMMAEMLQTEKTQEEE